MSDKLRAYSLGDLGRERQEIDTLAVPSDTISTWEKYRREVLEFFSRKNTVFLGGHRAGKTTLTREMETAARALAEYQEAEKQLLPGRDMMKRVLDQHLEAARAAAMLNMARRCTRACLNFRTLWIFSVPLPARIA